MKLVTHKSIFLFFRSSPHCRVATLEYENIVLTVSTFSVVLYWLSHTEKDTSATQYSMRIVSDRHALHEIRAMKLFDGKSTELNEV